MSTNPEDPDDTLQKILSRRAHLTNAYNVTDALSLEEMTKIRSQQLKSQEKAQRPTPPRDTTRAKTYWFDKR
jgi:hypothetical protein